ncbi:MAG: hypothetical protein QN198_02375 [Armatimonadota bacterium]|nr:hypothetical protein [Armatimonadota bacterium]MDR5702432.1 hypothetical protein [Armatimonadota bacterium]MDR7434329.1 hypothetical protein [Armatimonadota bacterium]
MARYRSRLPVKEFQVIHRFCLHKPGNVRRFLGLSSREAHELSGLALAGVVNTSDEVIYIDHCLSEPEKEFTEIHELVHARRQINGEELQDYDLEEIYVELETIARTRRPTLLSLFPNTLLILLHDYLTERGRLKPDRKQDLAKIYRKIEALIALMCPGRS